MDSKPSVLKKEAPEEQAEETKVPTKKRKQSQAETLTQGGRTKTKRPKTEESYDLRTADLNTRKENLPLSGSLGSTVAARRNQKK